MNLSSDFNDVIETNLVIGTETKEIFQRGVGRTLLSDRIQLGNPATPSERDISYQRDRSIGTNCGIMVRVMPPTVQQDTYLDNEIGEAVRDAKAKFGKAHFLEAYKRVLNTSKKIDDEWEAYSVEEARLQSILEEGED